MLEIHEDTKNPVSTGHIPYQDEQSVFTYVVGIVAEMSGGAIAYSAGFILTASRPVRISASTLQLSAVPFQ